MKSLFEVPMSLRATSIAGLILMLAGTVYCDVFSALQQPPLTIDVCATWSVIALLPWLAAFEIGKRINYEPMGSWNANWGRIVVLLMLTAAISIAFQGWLLTSPQSLSWRWAALAAVRRIPAAIVVSALLLLVPMFPRQGERKDAGPAVPTKDELPLLPQQIDWIRAAENYLEIMAGQRLILHRMTMARAEQLLTHHDFIRVHRSALINAKKVKRLDRGRVADEIVLHDDTRLKVGAAYRSLVERALRSGSAP